MKRSNVWRERRRTGGLAQTKPALVASATRCVWLGAWEAWQAVRASDECSSLCREWDSVGTGRSWHAGLSVVFGLRGSTAIGVATHREQQKPTPTRMRALRPRCRQQWRHRPPSTVHRPPSTVHRPPSTVHRLPSTVYRPDPCPSK